MHAARAEIVVDLAAVRHNVRVLREATGTPVMVVVKADAYGHGLVECARAAREAGAAWLGVATLDEAVELRAAGDTGRVLCWLTVPQDDWGPAVAAGVDVTAYSLDDLDAVERAVAATGRPALLQLKIDTGLSRGGATAADWPALVAAARDGERRGRWRVSGVWSHFACADQPDHPANDAQHAAFDEALAVAEATGLRPEVRHLANSAGALLRPGARLDLVRCGLAAYGLDPAPGHTPDLGLRPAMSVTAVLAGVKRVEAGAGVSYGHTWVADRPTTLGLVPLGYGDGVPWHAGNRAEVGIDGKRRPLRGRVCMDQVIVDLGADGAGEVRPGDPVVLIGEGGPTAQDWAEASGTISYEIVTGFGAHAGGRLTRRHVGVAS